MTRQKIVVPKQAGGGNTKLPPRNPNDKTEKPVKSNQQLKNWVGTLFSGSAPGSKLPEPYEFADALSRFCCRFVFQKECCATSKRLHYQFALSCNIPQTLMQVKNQVPGGAHLEPMRCVWKGFAYCEKSATRVEGPWNETSNFKLERFVLTYEQAMPWQQQAARILTSCEDDRAIYWITDVIGGIGKSRFALMMNQRYGTALVQAGKSADIAHMFRDKPPTSIIFDVPRSQGNRIDYELLEHLKNGVLMASKYESKLLVFPPPTIMVLANADPVWSAISEDRWRYGSVSRDCSSCCGSGSVRGAFGTPYCQLRGAFGVPCGALTFLRAARDSELGEVEEISLDDINNRFNQRNNAVQIPEVQETITPRREVEGDEGSK